MAESTTTLFGILKINSTAAKNYITNKLSSYAMKSDVTASLDKKQDKLTFDITPATNSNNPVTSDGIKKAIDKSSSDFLDGCTTETVAALWGTVTNADTTTY
jgi:hypothetical protein